MNSAKTKRRPPRNAAATGLRSEIILQQESQVCRALGQSPHEIGKPITAVRDVDANAVAILDQSALQICADAIQHLELEGILADLLRRSPADRFGDHE